MQFGLLSPFRDGDPTKHLFGLSRDNRSSCLQTLEPQTAFQRRDQTPQRGPETHRSTPIGYPFKMKAATASLAVAGGWAAPVFCGHAVGADAPKML